MIIKKVNLIKNGCVEVAYTDNEGNDVTLKGANVAHPDLKAAMNRLVPYLCELTEQKEAEKIDWEFPESDANVELLRIMNVRGFTISGSDSTMTCVINGSRILTVTNKVLKISSPAVSIDEESDYARVFGLREAVDMIVEEAKLYVTEHKYQIVQTQIDFENPDDPFGDGGDAGESEPLKEAV